MSVRAFVHSARSIGHKAVSKSGVDERMLEMMRPSPHCRYCDAVSYEGNPTSAARLRISYALCRAADIDCSCQVAINDVQAVAAHWGLTSADPGWNRLYDLASNGVIEAADVIAAASAWGQTGCP